MFARCKFLSCFFIFMLSGCVPPYPGIQELPTPPTWSTDLTAGVRHFEIRRIEMAQLDSHGNTYTIFTMSDQPNYGLAKVDNHGNPAWLLYDFVPFLGYTPKIQMTVDPNGNIFIVMYLETGSGLMLETAKVSDNGELIWKNTTVLPSYYTSFYLENTQNNSGQLYISYVSDGIAHILKYSATGTPTEIYSVTNQHAPDYGDNKSFKIASDNSLYFLHTNRLQVTHLSENGIFLHSTTNNTPIITHFIDLNGNLYLLERDNDIRAKVKKIAVNGDILWEKIVPAGECADHLDPLLILQANGNLNVATYTRNSSNRFRCNGYTIRRFNASGDELDPIQRPGLGGNLNLPLVNHVNIFHTIQLKTDAMSNLYVLERYSYIYDYIPDIAFQRSLNLALTRKHEASGSLVKAVLLNNGGDFIYDYRVNQSGALTFYTRTSALQISNVF